MIQIIGLLGCLYLFIKGCEFVASNNYRDETGQMKGSAAVGTMFSFAGAIGFSVALYLQGAELRTVSDMTYNESEAAAALADTYAACVELAAGDPALLAQC